MLVLSSTFVYSELINTIPKQPLNLNNVLEYILNHNIIPAPRSLHCLNSIHALQDP